MSGRLHDEESGSSRPEEGSSTKTSQFDMAEQSFTSPLLPPPPMQPMEQHGLSCTSPVAAATLLFDALHGEPQGQTSLLERTLFGSATAFMESDPHITSASPTMSLANASQRQDKNGGSNSKAAESGPTRALPRSHMTEYTTTMTTDVSMSSRPGCSTALEHDTRTDTTSYLTNNVMAMPRHAIHEYSQSDASYNKEKQRTHNTIASQSPDYQPPWLAQYVLPPRARPETSPTRGNVTQNTKVNIPSPPPPVSAPGLNSNAAPANVTSSSSSTAIIDTLMSEWWWQRDTSSSLSPSLPAAAQAYATRTERVATSLAEQSIVPDASDAARMLWYTSPSPPPTRHTAEGEPLPSLSPAQLLSPPSPNILPVKAKEGNTNATDVGKVKDRQESTRTEYTKGMCEARQSNSPPARRVPDRRARLEGWVAQSPREAAERRRRSMSMNDTQDTKSTAAAVTTCSTYGITKAFPLSPASPVCDITNTPRLRYEAGKKKGTAALLAVRQMMGMQGTTSNVKAETH